MVAVVPTLSGGFYARCKQLLRRRRVVLRFRRAARTEDKEKPRERQQDATHTRQHRHANRHTARSHSCSEVSLSWDMGRRYRDRQPTSTWFERRRRRGHKRERGRRRRRKREWERERERQRRTLTAADKRGGTLGKTLEACLAGIDRVEKTSPPNHGDIASMNSPPDPLLTLKLLEQIARLLLRLLPEGAGRFGALYDSSGERVHLYAVGGASRGTIEWALSKEVAPLLASHAMTEPAFKVLQNGVINAEGLIAYDGANYAMQTLFDGANHIAEVTIVR